jgi:hypothetical protein
MPGEFYFMAVGGLGVTLAGFAGLIAALQGPEGAVAAWRIRNVVYLGFSVTFIGFGTVALYTITQEVTLTVRLASILMLLTRAALWGEFRPSAAWRDERQRRGGIGIQIVFAGLAILSIVVASLGFFQLLVLLFLSAPAGIFARAVRDVTRGASPDGHAPEESEK